ncbi:hypothetical protein NW762_000698 [Fusarium torreyae]|uniref:Helicase C-terminal domain-containing protein n=1 Tax=Fusarium torreyae TaxID=1237075 RepID=A0A9W8SIB8_9HYPO|nr:hypothetical protein NW762_000698 [Fusarium torreyae]
MHPHPAAFIPVGCIPIKKEELYIDSEVWCSDDLRDWRTFRFLSNSPSGSNFDTHDGFLPLDLEGSLTNIRRLEPYFRLCRDSWARLEFSVRNKASDQGTLRVYLLPDDVLRRAVNRSDAFLQKTKRTIITQLNYSIDAWRGDTEAYWLDSPRPHESAPHNGNLEEGMSLLQLFNNIPSPKPEVDSIQDPYSKSAICDLLSGSIPGLTSELYPYQRKSSALMLQKEVQPKQVLDPRLLHVQDQEGGEFYIDPVTGTILKEPRYYDGVSGGILAEEMGSGKTIICLALILATKTLPTQPPEHFRAGDVPTRKRLAPLAEMAASCATRNSVPWKPYFDLCKDQSGEEYERCIDALERNPGYYFLPAPQPPRASRRLCQPVEQPKKRLYLSNATIVVVPPNLLSQWQQEIRKHTDGMETLVVTRDKALPSAKNLLKYDLILFSQTRFETIYRHEGGLANSPLSEVHFKRCIVDEGHKLGNSKISSKSNMLIGLDSLQFSSRWIVTGTPSQGLYGVDAHQTCDEILKTNKENPDATKPREDTSKFDFEMEKRDLERIGAIAALYLKVRPWANTIFDAGDTLADWTVYLMLPKHKSTSRGHWDCLRSTLNSLIIRHQLAEVSDLLPPVEEKLVILEGSYQDQLSLNIFSMMIIFNSVQSQRTDADYFFHPKQRKALFQIVHNLKQASFFGGSFYSKEDITKAVETAEGFLRDKKIPISDEDQHLLEQAIEFGHLVMNNKVRTLSNRFHEMPVCVEDLPHGFSTSWSLDGETGDGMCSSSTMLLSLQQLVYKSASNPEELNSLLNGRLIQEGVDERQRMLASNETIPSRENSQTLAGNTKLGDDSHRNVRSHGVHDVKPEVKATADGALGPLEAAKITSTVSAKLSYLIDSILRYQEDDKILIFYENDNIAWYLAGMLEVLQVQHLIYAKGLTTKRRAQYVNTFHHNANFRVLLMDITQAAFGLDMREASRIYFLSPVLNPQVEAQAIGRARRISQQKPVFVETLVLKNSIEEVILERRQHMTQAEHRQVKSILDVGPIYDWIKNAQITPLPGGKVSKESQMAPLNTPQYIFRRGFGRTMHPDEGLVLDDSPTRNKTGVRDVLKPLNMTNGLKRGEQTDAASIGQPQVEGKDSSSATRDLAARPAKRVRFAAGSDED